MRGVLCLRITAIMTPRKINEFVTVNHFNDSGPLKFITLTKYKLNNNFECATGCGLIELLPYIHVYIKSFHLQS